MKNTTHTYTQVEALRQARETCARLWKISIEEMEDVMVEYGMQFVEKLGEDEWYTQTVQRSKAFWLFWKYQWLLDDRLLSATVHTGKISYQQLKATMIEDPTIRKRWMLEHANIDIV